MLKLFKIVTILRDRTVLSAVSDDLAGAARVSGSFEALWLRLRGAEKKHVDNPGNSPE